MKKKYKIKVTPKLIKQLKPYWKQYKKIADNYYGQLNEIERKMSKKIGIEDLELFLCDGEVVGVGNYSRTMKLIRGEELE